MIRPSKEFGALTTYFKKAEETKWETLGSLPLPEITRDGEFNINDFGDVKITLKKPASK